MNETYLRDAIQLVFRVKAGIHLNEPEPIRFPIPGILQKLPELSLTPSLTPLFEAL